jgi:hypothetical protein
VQVADLHDEPPVSQESAPVHEIILKAGYQARMIVPLLGANRAVGASWCAETRPANRLERLIAEHSLWHATAKRGGYVPTEEAWLRFAISAYNRLRINMLLA